MSRTWRAAFDTTLMSWVSRMRTGGGNDFTHVSRDDAGIYLSEGDQGHPGTWVWIGVEDVASL